MGNTTNLKNHLRVHHPVLFSEFNRSKSAPKSSDQPLITHALSNIQKYKKDSAKWQSLTDSVSRYIAAEMLPFNTVESPEFKEMLTNFDQRYELPGKSYISNIAIPSLYETVKKEVTCQLQNAEYFSATTDMWSSINIAPYMSFTVHFVTSEWTLKSCCLETRYVPENHTADNLADTLKLIMESWGLKERQLSCITTDNGANIVAAIGKLNWPWLNCFGHNLHLAVTNSVLRDKESTSSALKNCRSLISTFHHSWKKKRELKKAQEELNLPQRSLILDVSTRWGTKQKMIERVLEQLPAIRRVLVDDRKHSHICPSWEDISVLESINSAIKPVADFTDILSGEKYVTVSSVKPVLELLTQQLLRPCSEDPTLTQEIKERICEIMKQKYRAEKVQSLLGKATMLDPRYKGHIAEERAIYEEQLLNEMLEITNERSGEDSVMLVMEASTSTSQPAAKKKRLCDLLQPRKTFSSVDVTSKKESAQSELMRYLQEDVVDASADPLLWWRDNEFRYPLVAKLAKKYMCICATSTASERLFSTAGNIVTPVRNCLKPEKVNMLVFLSRNICSNHTAVKGKF